MHDKNVPAYLRIDDYLRDRVAYHSGQAPAAGRPKRSDTVGGQRTPAKYWRRLLELIDEGEALAREQRPRPSRPKALPVRESDLRENSPPPGWASQDGAEHRLIV